MEFYTSIYTYDDTFSYQYDPIRYIGCLVGPTPCLMLKLHPSLFHRLHLYPPNPTFLSHVQIRMISTSINTIQELVMELKETNSCMLSLLFHMRSQFQEMQWDSMTLDEIETKKATLEDATENFVIVCKDETDFDLIDGNSSFVDNSILPSERLRNPVKSFETNLCWSRPFIVATEILPMIGDPAVAFADHQLFDRSFKRKTDKIFSFVKKELSFFLSVTKIIYFVDIE